MKYNVALAMLFSLIAGVAAGAQPAPGQAPAPVSGPVSAPAPIPAPGLVEVFTHGEGKFGMKQADGRLLGPGVDALECAMKALDQPYSLEAVSMARSNRLDAEGRDHIWFPTYDTGDPERAARLAGPIGWLAIQWFLPHGARLRPDMPGFKARARVTAFPGSHPEVLLRRGGFNLVPGTDDENRLVLWLVEGKVDAALSADFRETLKAGAADYARSLDIVPYTRLPVAFELTRGFAKHHPGFRPRFQAALDTCRARGIPAEE